MNYAVANTNYPGHCLETIAWPVSLDSDPGYALDQALQNALGVGTPFSCALEEAIQCTDRHVYIQGSPPNPEVFVQDWMNMLRWEARELWNSSAASGRLDRNNDRKLTYEHYLHSGELLAEGLAILFISKQLGINRQRFFFHKGTDSRPDFVANLKRYHGRAFFQGRSRVALEVRMRHAQRNLHKDDKAELTAKKHSFNSAIGVYVIYGNGRHRDGTPHTRLHLSDPEGDHIAEASDVEAASAAIYYYLALTSQVGLWEYRDHLLRAVRDVQAGVLLQDRMSDFRATQVRTGIQRNVEGETCRGREFNSLVADATRMSASVSELQMIRTSARARADAGDFGITSFRGLSTSVLKLIAESDWLSLLDYSQQEFSTSDGTQMIRADGVGLQQYRVEPDSEHANEIRSLLP